MQSVDGDVRLSVGLDIEKSKKNIAKLESELTKTQRQLEKATQKQEKAYTTLNNNIDKANKNLQSSTAQLNEKYTRTSNILRKNAEQLQEMVAKQNAAKDSISSYTSQIENMESTYSKLKSQMGDMSAEDYTYTAGQLQKYEDKLVELYAKEKKMEDVGKTSTRSKTYKNLQYDIENTKRAINELVIEFTDEDTITKNVVKEYIKLQAGLQSANTEYANCTSKIEDLTSKQQIYQSQLSTTTQRQDDISNETDTYNRRLSDLNTQLEQEQAGTGQYVQSVSDLQNKIEQINNALITERDALAQAEEEEEQTSSTLYKLGTATVQFLSNLKTNTINTFKNAVGALGTGMRNLAINAAKVASSKINSGIKKITSGFKKLLSNVLKLNKGTKKSNNIFAKLVSYAFGIRSLYYLFNKLKTALVEGIQTLAQADEETNESISNLKTSLTALKNSIAAACAPIINTFSPALTQLIDLLSEATTQLGMFFAALAGQDTFKKAVKVQENYAESLSDTASSAGDASDSLKKYLSPVDDLNKYDDGSGSDSGSSSSTTTDPSEYFQEVSLDNLPVADFGKLLRQKIEEQDFSGAGELLAQKLNEMISSVKDKISWANVGNGITNVMNAITQTINSFVANVDMTNVGATIGEGLNTITNTIDLWYTGIDWTSIGTKISDGVNGLFDTVNWEQVGTTLGDKIQSINNLFTGLTNIDWDTIGTSLGTAFNNMISTVNWGQLASNIVDLLFAPIELLSSLGDQIDWEEVANAINEFFTKLNEKVKEKLQNIDWQEVGNEIGSFLQQIDWSAIVSGMLYNLTYALLGLGTMIGSAILTLFSSEDSQSSCEEAGGNVIAGVLQGILNGLFSIAYWIQTNVFDPIIEAFCDVFGIHSPSTVMEEKGGYIIDGLINGVTASFSKVVEIFSKLWESIQKVFSKVGEFFLKVWAKIKAAFSNVKTWIGEKFSAAWDKIKSIFDVTKVKETFQKVWQGIKDVFKNVTTWFSDKFTAAWDAVKNVFSAGGEIFSGIVDGVSSTFKTIVNFLIDGINSIIATPFNKINEMLNSIRNISILGATPFAGLWGENPLAIPQIPKLARGAVLPANKPFLAMLGDQTQGNNIETPESLLRQIVREETANNSNGNGKTTVVAQVNRKTLFELVIEEAKAKQQMTGKNPFEFA